MCPSLCSSLLVDMWAYCTNIILEPPLPVIETSVTAPLFQLLFFTGYHFILFHNFVIRPNSSIILRKRTWNHFIFENLYV